jgi:hypothetical protein
VRVAAVFTTKATKNTKKHVVAITFGVFEIFVVLA